MIKLLVLDVDGTLTDGKLYFGDKGEMMKAFHVKDGYAFIHFLPEMNVVPIIITGRTSNILLERCKELNITHIYQNVKNKIEKLKEVCKDFNIELSQVAYIGDDLNDLDCMKVCGYKGCPADAVDEVKAICDFISSKNGGEGAVREFIEKIKTLTV